MIKWLQYAVVWTFVKALGTLQRSAARWLAARGAQLPLERNTEPDHRPNLPHFTPACSC